ncbi:PA0069 family radical SAM protein [Winogradskyella immobilis]|uniref:PA0069 family radical SAM protein n=1 Tax=Winogradskyella immobilis TaxID=2816852 RepID=A0ABS8EPQ7_9FLAO|nr:PA0069 family radical SAM protein [Winogradskyella immobilis]MCC1485208.1 PA0069 family radical SAM protein [Winogradskyella immobilis]MCG0017300.1 PA0069 family radical SAM protein [Winogradskyella immobilis]
MSSKSIIKGRGAQQNVHNRFFELSYEMRDDFLEYCQKEGELADKNKTLYLPVFPKTIVNKVTSPDVGMAYSMNMYQGCEHGCIYCYARNSHEYWGYSAGLDFERRILVKKDAPKLLEAFLKKKTWKAYPIVMSGNTDCYQPAEKQFQITRQCLEVFLKYKHPVGIITKNALILRDLDLLKALAKENLIGVNISITSLSETTRRVLEPRTATIKKRLETVKILSENGIPVNVMLAPIIPSINSHEILPLAKTVAEHGALSIAHTIVRLNGAIGEIFTDWVRKTMPDRADKVLHQIEDCHGGTLNESRYGKRMRGEGKIAEQINTMVRLARSKYFKGKQMPKLNCDLHEQYKTGQMRLF